jgi:hypothetical protein
MSSPWSQRRTSCPPKYLRTAVLTGWRAGRSSCHAVGLVGRQGGWPQSTQSGPWNSGAKRRNVAEIRLTSSRDLLWGGTVTSAVPNCRSRPEADIVPAYYLNISRDFGTHGWVSYSMAIFTRVFADPRLRFAVLGEPSRSSSWYPRPTKLVSSFGEGQDTRSAVGTTHIAIGGRAWVTTVRFTANEPTRNI